jgi:hypothetical protein
MIDAGRHYRRHDRVVALALTGSVIAVTSVLLLIRYVPLQDFPQQVKMLTQIRELAPGHQTEFFRSRTGLVFGYQLYCWIDRLWAPLLSPLWSLRLQTILAFLLTPIAAFRLARAIDVDPWLAALLAAPLALSTHFKLGILPFCLGIPISMLALASAIRLLDDRRVVRVLELMTWLTLSQLAHPLTLGIALLMMGPMWLYRGRRDPFVTAGYLAAAAPALLMFAHDARAHAYGNIPGAELAWPVWGMTTQWIGEILNRIPTLAYGSYGVGSLVGRIPAIIATLACLAVAVRHWRGDGGLRTALLATVALLTLLGIILPRDIGTTFCFAGRFPFVALLLCAVIGGQATEHLSRRKLAVVASAIMLAMALNCTEFVAQSERVRSVIGDAPSPVLSGAILPVRFMPCQGDMREARTGFEIALYHPLWHVWAYVSTSDTFAPQVFAFSGYHQVQARADRYGDMAGAPDWLILSPWQPNHRCEDNNLFRLLWATGIAKYDTIVATELPAKFIPALEGAGFSTQAIGPGLTVIRRLAHAAAPLVNPPLPASPDPRPRPDSRS